ncbi:hypothetical protein MMC17_000336 [Xylographa soralifera]|nr:hypothetical protein [Xylographa soralifera]
MESSLDLDTECLLDHEKPSEESYTCCLSWFKDVPKKLKLLPVLLVLSITCNVLLSSGLAFWTLKSSWRSPDDYPTPYASLKREIPLAWTWNSVFSNDNLTAVFEAWEQVNHDAGAIVLPDDYVAEKQLPPSQRFEWDDTKGVYIVNGYHNLHCLKVIALTLDELRRGKPIRRPFKHSVHCLDALRQDVLCDADDTPRWTGSGDGMSGVGQVRHCKDWSRLEAWAESYTACHRHIHLNHGDDMLERYKFCPKDSPYAAKIKAHFPDIDLDI